MKKLIIFLLLVAFLSGCASDYIETPSGWVVNLNRSFLTTNFDKAAIEIRPDGTIILTVENFKSSDQEAMDILKTIMLSGAAGTQIPVK